MNDLLLVIANTVLFCVILISGIYLVFWSKKAAMWQTKINLWLWYRFFPNIPTAMFGKQEDLENSFVIKLTTWWVRFIGVGLLFIALILTSVFFQ